MRSTTMSVVMPSASPSNFRIARWRIAGTTTVVPGFSTAYQSGVKYTVVAYTGANGATQFATLADTYTPASTAVTRTRKFCSR